jgi:hypothetical protein
LRLFAPGGAGRKNRCAVSAPQRKALYASAKSFHVDGFHFVALSLLESS